MTREDLYDGISGIREDFLEEAAAYHTPKRIRWKRLTTAAACAVLLLCTAFSFIRGSKSGTPFVVTAYAVSPDGSIVGQNMAERMRFPVSRIESKNGTAGFLFSIGETDPDQPASVSVLTAGNYDDSAVYDMVEIAGLEMKPGRSYVFFVGAASDVSDLTFYHKNRDGSVNVKVTVSVTETANGYMAELQKLTSYPVNDQSR